MEKSSVITYFSSHTTNSSFDARKHQLPLSNKGFRNVHKGEAKAARTLLVK